MGGERDDIVRDLVICGSGIHGQEMGEIVERINRVRPTWNVLGYMAEERRAAEGATLNGYSVLGTVAEVGRLAERFPGAWVIADNECRVALPTERLATLVDPSVFVSRTATIGAGCVVYPNGFIGARAVLGTRVFALSGAIINHDVTLAEGVVVCSGVSLAGSVTVEAGCYLGQACTVKQHVRIGRDCLIGMGSVVLRDVPANSVMVGNPARRLRARYDRSEP